MTRAKRSRLIGSLATLPVIALVAAGCGGGSNSQAASAPSNAASAQATISTGSAGNLGTILVDSRGRTLYLFRKDSGTKSACYGACASAWPPLRDAGKPTVGGGLNVALVGTTSRSDRIPQVTYNGHPLYLFASDQKPGDTEGQGSTAFGGGWFALNRAGNQVSSQASSGSTNSSSAGGYAY